jgi:hypothetical protein
MTRSCRTSSIPTRSTCSTRRASNMHRHSLWRSDVLEIVFAHFPRSQCSSHHFAYLQIHMFMGPISSHPFSGIASHHFPVRIIFQVAQIHIFTAPSVQTISEPHCFFFLDSTDRRICRSRSFTSFFNLLHIIFMVPQIHMFWDSKGSHHFQVLPDHTIPGPVASFFSRLLHILF